MQQTESKLIQQAKEGDEAALEALFRSHVHGAIRLAYLITRSWATAEDTVQEAFLQAFRSLATFQEGRPFKPWLTRIVANKAKRARDRLRREYPTTDFQERNPHRAFKPEESVLEKEELDAFFAAVNSLGDQHRLPLLLKYLSGLSEAETAQVLEIPVSTVKSRLYVARQRLKASLGIMKEGEPGEL